MAAVTDDEIFPIHFIDQAAIIRSSIINYTFRFEEVLDAEVLRTALETLLKQPEWRKLGGRLRVNKSGRLEIHGPRTFSPLRPAFKLSTRFVASRIANDPLGAHLPASTGKLPSVQPGYKDFMAFSLSPDHPRTMEHYLEFDNPILDILVTVFQDATLVSITHPHAVADAAGTCAFMRAWSDTLANDNTVKSRSVANTKEDVLEHVGTSYDVEAEGHHVLERLLFSRLTMLLFIVRLLWDMLTVSKSETRTVYVPKGFMRALRQGAENDLRHQEASKHCPFMSNGDLLTAWVAQKTFQQRSRNRSGVILNIVNMRTRMGTVFDSSAAYVQNLVLPSYTYLPKWVASNMSLGQMACEIRETLLKQATDLQLRRLMRTMRSSGFPPNYPLFGKSDSIMFACTNWSKMGFPQAINFAGAVVSKPEQTMKSSTSHINGACTGYWGLTVGTKDQPQDTIIIYGEDGEGNTWVEGFLRRGVWKKIEEDFRAYSRSLKI